MPKTTSMRSADPHTRRVQLRWLFLATVLRLYPDFEARLIGLISQIYSLGTSSQSFLSALERCDDVEARDLANDLFDDIASWLSDLHLDDQDWSRPYLLILVRNLGSSTPPPLMKVINGVVSPELHASVAPTPAQLCQVYGMGTSETHVYNSSSPPPLLQSEEWNPALEAWHAWKKRHDHSLSTYRTERLAWETGRVPTLSKSLERHLIWLARRTVEQMTLESIAREDSAKTDYQTVQHAIKMLAPQILNQT